MSDKLKTDPIYAKILNEPTGVTKRQEIIRSIQDKQPESKVVTYTALFGHPAASIDANDTRPFDDLLRSLGKVKRLILMIQSAGGSAESAKKIVSLCRTYCDEFWVVVPDSAKSAATIIALGADKIVMSNTSELGPIDPQFIYQSPQGGITLRPAWTFVKGYEKVIGEAVTDGKLNSAYVPILANMDIQQVQLASAAIKDAQDIAEEFLKTGMLKNDHTKASETAAKLSRGEVYAMHGHLIDYREARKLVGESNIEYLPPDSEIWQLYWELYCRSATFVHPPFLKLFENEKTSLNIRGA